MTQDRGFDPAHLKPLALIVDDDGGGHARLADLLARHGYEVASQPWGLVALKFASRVRPSLVISVVRTPWREEGPLLRRLLEATPGPRRLTLYAGPGRAA